MQLVGKAIRVTIYIGESDRYQGKALYTALLEFLRREGASGATVTRGLAGFGAGSRIHTATIITLSGDLPLCIEWVDQPEVVERLMPQVRQMVDDGLITVEEVDVVQYAPGRRPDPLALPVGNVMRTEVTTVRPETAVEEIVTLLLRRGRRSVPVIDERRQILGIITDGDLLRRAGIVARLDLQEALTAEEVQEQVEALQQRGQRAADVMTAPVVTVGAADTLGQAMDQMVAQGLKRLPVVDEGRRLAGWISRVDVMRTLAYHQGRPEANRAQPSQGSSIAELMYREVPAVQEDAGLEEVLQIMEAGRYRRVVVVDAEKRVMGIITDGDLLRRSQQEETPGLTARLRSLFTGSADQAPFLGGDETAAGLMSAPVVCILVDDALPEALGLMLDHNVKRLPVVDGDGRLVGLLGRGRLLRGLLTTES